MLSFNDMDYRCLQVVSEGAVPAPEAINIRGFLNLSIAFGKRVFDRVELVDVSDCPAKDCTGLYLTTPGWRLFVMLIGHRPTCKLDLLALSANVEAIWQAGATLDDVISTLASRSGVNSLAKGWSRELAPTLRADERTKDAACDAIRDVAEDLTNWSFIPPETQIDVYAWKVTEATR
jgi:hypothetical protein